MPRKFILDSPVPREDVTQLDVRTWSIQEDNPRTVTVTVGNLAGGTAITSDEVLILGLPALLSQPANFTGATVKDMLDHLAEILLEAAVSQQGRSGQLEG